MRSKASDLLALRERAFGDSGAAAHGVEKTIRRVDAVEIFGYFAAEKSLGDGIVRVTLHARCPPGVVDGNEDATGVGAIMRADGVDCLCGWHI